MNYPQLATIGQRFSAQRLEDVPGELQSELAACEAAIRPGARIAIAVGSRGIANLVVMVRQLVAWVKTRKAVPFIVPAMGSHGGGTAEGQRRVVESYGITEEFVGCPIRSSPETVVIGQAAEGFPIHVDRLAFEADHVVVCNRVKPHTGFCGPIESGLLKMLLIGLGNCEGARTYHRAIQDFSFDRIIRSVAGEVLARCHVLAGVAVVENAYDQPARIEAVAPEQFVARETELLTLAKRLLPRLPFPQIDVLLIDRIGKDISGTGMDPNVVGRKFNDHKAVDDEWPKVRRIAVRGLSEASHGNAIGLGMAEFCRSRALEQIDVAATRLNGLVSGHVSAVMTPLDYNTDREMLTAALSTIGLAEPPQAKLLWIADTLHLGEVECSAAYLEEARGRDDLEVLTSPRDLPFDVAGNLSDMGRAARTS